MSQPPNDQGNKNWRGGGAHRGGGKSGGGGGRGGRSGGRVGDNQSGRGGGRAGDNQSGRGGSRARDNQSGRGGGRAGNEQSGRGGGRAGNEQSGRGGGRAGDKQSGRGGGRAGDERSGRGGGRAGDNQSGRGGRAGENQSGRGGGRAGDEQSGRGGGRAGDNQSGRGGRAGENQSGRGGGRAGDNQSGRGGGRAGENQSGRGGRAGDNQSGRGGGRAGDNQSGRGGGRAGNEQSERGRYQGQHGTSSPRDDFSHSGYPASFQNYSQPYNQHTGAAPPIPPQQFPSQPVLLFPPHHPGQIRYPAPQYQPPFSPPPTYTEHPPPPYATSPLGPMPNPPRFPSYPPPPSNPMNLPPHHQGSYRGTGSPHTVGGGTPSLIQPLLADDHTGGHNSRDGSYQGDTRGDYSRYRKRGGRGGSRGYPQRRYHGSRDRRSNRDESESLVGSDEDDVLSLYDEDHDEQERIEDEDSEEDNETAELEKYPALELDTIKSLLRKTQKDIASELVQKRKNLERLLFQREMSTSLTLNLMKALCLAFQEDSDNSHQIIDSILEQRRFLKLHVPQFILRTRINAEGECSQNLLDQTNTVTAVLEKLLQRMTKEAAAEILPSLVLIGDVHRDIESKSVSLAGMGNAKASLQSCLDKHSALITTKKAKKGSKKRRVRDGLDLFPDPEEIDDGSPVPLAVLEESCKYASTEAYVKTQFQMMREVIAEPIRQRVSKYRKLHEEQKVTVKTMNEIPVYQRVTIAGIVHSRDGRAGVVYRLNFDVSLLNPSHWQKQIHLAEGNVVCLSADHFNNVVYGIVRGRQMSDLSTGVVEIQVPRAEDVVSLLSTSAFYMIDSLQPADGVLDVLNTLQYLTDITLPFPQHIIAMNAPEERAGLCKGEGRVHYDLSSLVTNDTYKASASSVPLLDCESVLNQEDTKLDDSQTQALVAGLTSEVTSITGAPGTGKTYIANKLVDVLLRNQHKWSSSVTDNTQAPQVDSGPMLLISPDEVSLDHFLEGVGSSHDRGIVKLTESSGASMSEKKGTPGVVEQQEKFRQRLQCIHDNLKSAGCSILNVASLKHVMSPSHANSITQKGSMAEWIAPDVAQKAGKHTNIGSSAHVEGDNWVEHPVHIDYDPRTASQDSGAVSKKKTKLLGLLRHTDYMKIEQVHSVEDPWSLQSNERWRLYRSWTKELKSVAARQIQVICKEYDDLMLHERMRMDKADFVQYQNATMLCVTSSSAVQFHRILRYVQPKVVIVDQAADVMEAVLIASLTQKCQQLIMVGDSKAQLQVNSAIRDLAVTRNTALSFFERIINRSYAVVTLTKQHRMVPAISRFIKKDFPDLQPNMNETKPNKLLGISQSVYFMSHCVPLDGASTHEAAFVIALCQYLMCQGYKGSDILVLTCSNGQRNRLKKGMLKETAQGVSVQLVDYCLVERNVVLFSAFQLQNQSGRRLRVEESLMRAFTRSRLCFYGIGNFESMAEGDSNILAEAKRVGNSGYELPLTCGNHPDEHDVARTSEDLLTRIQTGGCGRTCSARLKCGHSCTKRCHKHDNKQLGSYKCEQPCQKPIASCRAGHKCTKRCFEKCVKACNRESEVELPCGHTQLAGCSLRKEEVVCRNICSNVLSCGHPCRNRCGLACVTNCQERVTRDEWPCKHVVEVACSDTMDMCPFPCKEPLRCGHACQGTCGSCLQGRLHRVCEKPCRRILVCGHQCKDKCATACRPCTEDCQNKCKHSRCTESCGENCIPCQEHCEWQCPHQACRQTCCQPCDRAACKQPCKKKTLRCGHDCIGLCGEPCPKKCRICDEDEVTAIFFGSEDEPDARFVELEDCGHVLEVSGLDTWMNTSTDSPDSETIMLKGCPKCKTPIRKNLRYGNIIKRTLADIEAVKGKMMGSAPEIKEKKRLLRKKIGLLEKAECFGLSADDASRFRENLDTCRHLETAVARLNRCNFLQEIVSLQTRVRQLRQVLENETEGKKTPRAHLDITEYRLKPLIRRLDGMKLFLSMGDLDRFTEQQTEDTLTEVIRIGKECEAAALVIQNLAWWDKNTDNQYLIIAFDNLMAKQKPLTGSEEDMVNTILSQIRSALGVPDISLPGMSDRERIQVVHAVGLSQGHWFKCKEGHIYAIGECGGAMERTRCPECGASIGGERHRLENTNILAGEMDGAQFAAYSKEANAARL